jgi:hypothetical protein
MTGRDGRRAVRNRGGVPRCLYAAVRRQSGRRCHVRGSPHRCGLPQTPYRPRIAAALVRVERGLPGCEGRRRRHRVGSGGGPLRDAAVVADPVFRHAATSRRRGRRERRLPVSCGGGRSGDGGLRLRSRDCAHRLLDGRYDLAGHELERGRRTRRTCRGSSTRKQEQRQTDRRGRERGGEVSAGDGYLQLHPGPAFDLRPVGRERRGESTYANRSEKQRSLLGMSQVVARLDQADAGLRRLRCSPT